MKRIKEFKVYKKKQSLSEIYQKSGMRFAFISAPKDGNKQSTPWVKCRDFLHDAFRAFILKSNCKIYGFSYNAKSDPPIDTRRTRMIIKDESLKPEILKKNIINGVNIINLYEELASLKTRTRRYQLSPGIWIINGPNMWLKSPTLLSMFTFLLRLGERGFTVSNIKELEKQFNEVKTLTPKILDDNDLRYLCGTWDKMSTIIKNYEAIFLCGRRYETCITKKGVDQLSIGTYHSNMGINSFCSGKSSNPEAYTRFIKILNDEPSKKKKLLRIKTEYYDSIYQNYDNTTLYMSVVSNPEDGRKQCFPFTKCREHVIASFRSSLSQDYDYIQFIEHNKNNPKVDLEMTRFLVTVSGVDSGKGKINKTKNELFFAKQVLNIYESMFGIIPTVISTVKLEHKEGTSTGWLFTSSKDWSNNPVMFSIYMLLIRSSKSACAILGPLKNLNVDDLENYWKKYYNYGKAASNASVHLNLQALLDVIKNRKFLFKALPHDNYFASNGSSMQEYYKKVGFETLVEGQHIDKQLNKQFKLLRRN